MTDLAQLAISQDENGLSIAKKLSELIPALQLLFANQITGPAVTQLIADARAEINSDIAQAIITATAQGKQQAVDQIMGGEVSVSLDTIQELASKATDIDSLLGNLTTTVGTKAAQSALDELVTKLGTLNVLTDAVAARSNLGVYSVNQTDALLAQKANIAHDHNALYPSKQELIDTTAALNTLQTQVNNFATAPIGNVIMWTFPTLPPDYIELWGATALRSQYTELFNLVQSSGMLRSQAEKQKSEWGDGDGSTTFSFPDFRDDHPEGWGGGQGLDPSRLLLGWKADEVKAHNHSAGTYKTAVYGYSPASGYRSAGTTGGGLLQNIAISGTSGTTGGPVNRVRSFAVTFAIKFK